MNETSELIEDGTQSLQERVQAAKTKRQAASIDKLPIPGYSGVLVARFRKPGWRTRREIALDHDEQDPVEAELLRSADLLVAACVGVEAHIDGSTTDLEMTLGVALAGYLGINMKDIDSDRQALFAIIPDEGDLVEYCGNLLVAQKREEVSSDNELVGE